MSRQNRNTPTTTVGGLLQLRLAGCSEEPDAESIREVERLEAGVREGHVRAALVLGVMHETGSFVTKDAKRAEEFYRFAAERGDPNGLTMLGIQLFDNEQYSEAKEYFEEASRMGEVEANVFLGTLYETGAGVEQNFDTAFQLYETAWINGSTRALRHLARCLQHGLGCESDLKESNALYRQACDSGDLTACLTLAHQYWREEDFDNAVEYYSQAADLGDVESQRIAGEYLALQDKNHRNPAKGVEYLQQAHNSGNRRAGYLLAVLYTQGRRVKKDLHKAFELCQHAANQSELDAQHMLGLLYIRGEGVVKNKEAGITWLRRASDAGHERASKILARMDSKTSESQT